MVHAPLGVAFFARSAAALQAGVAVLADNDLVCTEIPSGDEMSIIDLVIWMSACDGVGSAEGWLCTMTIEVADSSSARLMTSRG